MRIIVIFMVEKTPKVRGSSRNLYSSSNIFLVTKTRRMKWSLHVAQHFKDPWVDGVTILKWILDRMGGVWLD